MLPYKSGVANEDDFVTPRSIRKILNKKGHNIIYNVFGY